MRIREYPKDPPRKENPSGPVPVDMQAGSHEGFWGSPESEEEAGQDKLRSAVEWGIFHRFRGRTGPELPLLNLKPGVSPGFFRHGVPAAGVIDFPDRFAGMKDLQSLASGSLGGIYAFDFFQYHPEWEESLAEFSRLLRDGGRLFLNFFSAEHFRLAEALPGPGSGGLAGTAAIPELAISPVQLADAVFPLGLSIHHIVPYSSFYGNSLWVDRMKSRFRWERILDWISSDRKLYDFALFLEENLIAKMDPAMAPRFAAVLEKKSLPEKNEITWENRVSRNGTLTGPFTAPALADAAAIGDRESLKGVNLKTSLARHLEPVRNRVFFLHLLGISDADFEDPTWNHLLPEANLAEYRKWRRQERDDALSLGTIRTWHRLPEVAALLRHRQTPLGPGLEYQQMPEMLRRVFGYFGKDKAA